MITSGYLTLINVSSFLPSQGLTFVPAAVKGLAMNILLGSIWKTLIRSGVNYSYKAENYAYLDGVRGFLFLFCNELYLYFIEIL